MSSRVFDAAERSWMSGKHLRNCFVQGVFGMFCAGCFQECCWWPYDGWLRSSHGYRYFGPVTQAGESVALSLFTKIMDKTEDCSDTGWVDGSAKESEAKAAELDITLLST